MQIINEHDIFILARDLNPILRKGMEGVILIILSENAFEVEFVKNDGTNYEFEGNCTFTIDKSFISEITYKSPS